MSWKEETRGPMTNVSVITCIDLKMPDGPRFCVVTVIFFLILFSPVVVLSWWIHSRRSIDSASPFREVKVHEELAHVFIQRGEVKIW